MAALLLDNGKNLVRTGSSKGTFEGDSVFPDGSYGIGRDSGDSINDSRSYIDFLPNDRNLGLGEDCLD